MNDNGAKKPFDDIFPGLWDWFDLYDQAVHAKFEARATSTEFQFDDYWRQLLLGEQQPQP